MRGFSCRPKLCDLANAWTTVRTDDSAQVMLAAAVDSHAWALTRCRLIMEVTSADLGSYAAFCKCAGVNATKGRARTKSKAVASS